MKRLYFLIAAAMIFIAVKSQSFNVGDNVQANATLNIRSTAGGTLIAKHFLGDKGKVKAGPVTAAMGGITYIWYEVQWDTYPNLGWCVNDGLTKVTTASPCDILVQGTPTISPNPVQAGSSITVSYTIKNQGGSTAAASQTKIQIKNSAGTLITAPTFSEPSISAGGSIARTQSITIPIGTLAGTYTAIIILDNSSQLGQSNDSNDFTPGVAFNVAAVTPSPGAFMLSLTPECIGTSTQIRLNWTTSSNADSYDIYRNGSLIYNAISNQFINITVTAGTNYNYYVVAKNSSGNTNNSNGTLSATAPNCAPTCSYSLSSYSLSPASSAGTGTISVTANTGCTWTAVSNNTNWLTITSGSSGSGNGTVSFSYSVNTSTTYRTGTITVGGKTFTVIQAGASTSNAPTITSISPNPVIADANNNYQSITINGNNFVSTPTIKLTWTGQTNYTLHTTQITSTTNNQIVISIKLGNVADNWTVEVINPDGQTTGKFPFTVTASTSNNFTISFPLKNYTPYNAPVTSVFDHSGARYSANQKVVTFTGEEGTIIDYNEPPVVIEGINLYSFKKVNGSPFLVGEMNYKGTSSTGSATINYDGHPGYDYPIAIGTPVYAAADGNVELITSDDASGKYIKLQHNSNTYQTQYLHMNQITVTQGSSVKKEDLIGYSGNTGGASTGPHLHFEVKKLVGSQWVSVDPYGWKGSGTDPFTLTTNINLWETSNNLPKPTITNVNSNNQVTGKDGDQPIVINGANFVQGMIVKVAWEKPIIDEKTLSSNQVNWNSSSKITMTINTTNLTDNWTVEVINPDGQTTGKFPFTVTASTSSGVIYGFDTGNSIIASSIPSDIVFGYFKATESTYIPDVEFTAGNIISAKTKGLFVGTYHFGTPLFSPTYYQSGYDHKNTVTEEVNAYLNSAQKYIGKGFLPPMLDVEEQVINWTQNSNGTYSPKQKADPLQIMGAADLAQWIRDWVTQVYTQTQVMPVLYVTKSYAQSLYPYYLNGTIPNGTTPNEYPACKLFIAAPSDTEGVPNTIGWQQWPWIFHQFDCGPDGFGKVTPYGKVDLIAFNGDINAFNASIGLIGTGVSNLKNQNNLHLYPNPATNEFNIKIPNADSDLNVEIVNLQGAIIYSNIHNVVQDEILTINISNLLKGIYFVRLNGNSNRGVVKLIKE